jgi:hypothetical protein
MNNKDNSIQANSSSLENSDLLQIEELEERASFVVHGACACTCSCNCTSTSCIILF